MKYQLPKTRIPLFGLLPILVGVLAFGPALIGNQVGSTQAGANPGHSPLQNIDVAGTIPSNGGSFRGTLSIVSFGVNGTGQLVANGLVSGTLRDASGQVIGTVSNEYVPDIPVSTGGAGAPQVTCHILNLTLGPLDLNLLGLVVHLNQIHLTIDAQSGPGNLLGNLLCAIAHLLDGGGPLQQVVDLLNRIIDLLGG